jgi:hypothetical protein
MAWHCSTRAIVVPMGDFEKKIFWLLWFVLGLAAYWMPLVWGLVWSVVSLFVSWWIVYRSGWI